MALDAEVIFLGLNVHEWWVHLLAGDSGVFRFDHGFSEMPAVAMSIASAGAYTDLVYLTDVSDTEIVIQKQNATVGSTVRVTAIARNSTKLG